MRHYSMLAVLLVCASLALAQPNRCTLDTVVGTYALSYQGYMLMSASGTSQPAAVPIAGLALVAIDSQGAITSTGYQSTGGQISQGPMPGTLKLNSDCNGTVDWGGGVTGNLVVLHEGAEIHSIMTHGPAGSPVVSGTWKRISRTSNTVEPAQCSPNSLVGVYAIRQSGTMMMTQPGSSQAAPAPVAMMAVGWVGYDGLGSTTGIASLAGQVLPFAVADVKFDVKPDCTATSSSNLTSQGVTLGQAVGWGLVLDGGDEAWSIETQDPTGLPVLLGTWKRISPVPPLSQ